MQVRTKIRRQQIDAKEQKFVRPKEVPTITTLRCACAVHYDPLRVVYFGNARQVSEDHVIELQKYNTHTHLFTEFSQIFLQAN